MILECEKAERLVETTKNLVYFIFHFILLKRSWLVYKNVLSLYREIYKRNALFKSSFFENSLNFSDLISFENKKE